MAKRYLVALTEAQRGALRAISDVTVDSGEGGSALRGALEALDNGVWFADAERGGLIGAQARLAVEWGEEGDNSRYSRQEWRRFERASDLILSITRRRSS
jgi:hypothetical protein